MAEKQLLEETTKAYLPQILGWAIRKTGNRDVGEELAQEVFLQYYSAIVKASCVEKPEHLLWKVAHYCWCNHLRKKAKQGVVAELRENLWDGQDFANTLAEEEMQGKRIANMRKEISNLSHMQREAMILHYLEGLSVAEAAKKLGTTEGAVAWHLFDARKKVKKELEDMETKTAYVYRPGKLAIGASGDEGPDPDTKWLRASLIRQNLCLLCYEEGKTLDELVSLTGIPKPYLEFDLDWLAAREFMVLKGKRYTTAFPIIGRKHRQAVGTLFRDSELIDKVIAYLWGREKEIRSIGFYGADFSTERLMWPIVTLFISFVSRNSPLLTQLKRREHYPIRPDGGKYVVMASDMSEGQSLDPKGYSGEILWGGFSGIWSDSCIEGSNTEQYYWLGVHNFADARYHPAITRADCVTRSLLHRVYTDAAEPGFTEEMLEPQGKEVLAEAVADGLIKKEGDGYHPQYIVLTKEELRRLRDDIFVPLLQRIEPSLERLSKTIEDMHKRSFTRISQPYVDYHTYLDLWDFGIYTLMYAAQEGKLWVPEKAEDGVPLTLILIK